MKRDDDFYKMLMSRTSALPPGLTTISNPNFSTNDSPLITAFIAKRGDENFSVDDAVKYGIAPTRIWIDEADNIPPEAIGQLAVHYDKILFGEFFGTMKATSGFPTEPPTTITAADFLENLRKAQAEIAALPKELLLIESEIYCDRERFIRLDGQHAIFVMATRSTWLLHTPNAQDDLTGRQPLTLMGQAIEPIDWDPNLPVEEDTRRKAIRKRLADAMREQLSATQKEQQAQ